MDTVGLLRGRGLTQHDVHNPRFKNVLQIHLEIRCFCFSVSLKLMMYH
jgi:hypothetical protein